MNRAPFIIATVCLAIGGAVPAHAEGAAGQDYDLAVKRLRGCLNAGLGGAPRDSLTAAVTALRALCAPQIKAAHAALDQKIAAGSPAAFGNPQEMAAQKRAAHAELDDELVALVARRTGVRN